jgi:co-chaperonin GroES (HSP10)
MKYLRQCTALVLLVAFAAVAMSMAASSSALGNVEVSLQNKCTRDVNYTTVTNGATSKGKVSKGDKIKLSLAPGTEITVDEESFMTVSDADNGQTFQVCR